MSANTRLPDNRGYTIPELTISIVILGILIISLFSFSTYYFTNVTRYNAFVEMSVDSLCDYHCCAGN
ncbi:type II secretion system protein [Candidatus Saccharibacteria bacterium]|nr:type II secretion system protein [Candidatus Saccharibacteria bacterium]